MNNPTCSWVETLCLTLILEYATRGGVGPNVRPALEPFRALIPNVVTSGD